MGLRTHMLYQNAPVSLPKASPPKSECRYSHWRAYLVCQPSHKRAVVKPTSFSPKAVNSEGECFLLAVYMPVITIISKQQRKYIKLLI